jgi:hypothetical protein
VATRRLQQIQEALARRGRVLRIGRPAEAAQHFVRVEDVSAPSGRPLAIDQADQVKALEIAERRRRRVHELHAGPSARRREGFAFYAAPHRGGELVDRPVKVLVQTMRLDERVQD